MIVQLRWQVYHPPKEFGSINDDTKPQLGSTDGDDLKNPNASSSPSASVFAGVVIVTDWINAPLKQKDDITIVVLYK
jgi:hypothetical protein